MQRVYPRAVGDEAFQVLRQALIQQWPKGNGESSHAYVELRGLQSLHSCLHAEAKQLLLARNSHEIIRDRWRVTSVRLQFIDRRE